MRQGRDGQPSSGTAAPAEGPLCGDVGAHGPCELPARHEEDHRAGDWSWRVLSPPGVPAARPRTPTRLSWPAEPPEPGERWRMQDGEDWFKWRGRWRPSKRPLR